MWFFGVVGVFRGLMFGNSYGRAARPSYVAGNHEGHEGHEAGFY